MQTTVARMFDLFMLSYDSIQGAEHFVPASVAHLFGVSHIVVGCSGTPEDLAEMRLVLNIVSTDVYRVHAFNLYQGGSETGQ